MKKNKLIQIGKKVVELEISALKKLKNSLLEKNYIIEKNNKIKQVFKKASAFT